jgi:hypothetical protein
MAWFTPPTFLKQPHYKKKKYTKYMKRCFSRPWALHKEGQEYKEGVLGLPSLLPREFPCFRAGRSRPKVRRPNRPEFAGQSVEE